MLKISVKERQVINVLMAVFTPQLVVSYLKEYGLTPIYHSLFADNEINYCHYKYNHIHYGFNYGNLYSEHLKAQDAQIKANHNIDTYLKLEKQILNCQYNLRKLSRCSTTPIKSSIHTYSLLISSADGMIISRNKADKPVVLDKRNHKEIYNLYKIFKRKLSKYINRQNGSRALLLRVENPFHFVKHIYTHPHLHGLIASVSPYLVKKIKRHSNKIFKRVFKYEPVKKCSIQPTYNSVNQFIDYCLRDYHIQVKDTDTEFFKGIHSKLRYNQLHLAFNAQLNSSKGHRVAYYVATSTLRAMKRRLNKLEIKINEIIRQINTETELSVKYTIYTIKLILLNKNKPVRNNETRTKTNTRSKRSLNYNENFAHYTINYISIKKNLVKIRQNKKANQLSAFRNKYRYKYTTSGIPP